jgi:hypothetical protein
MESKHFGQSRDTAWAMSEENEVDVSLDKLGVAA